MTALRRHWPEYLMEAAELGLFMMSASLFAVVLEHPASPVHLAIPDPVVRRLVMGLAMGATAVSIIYSPLGQQSGGHFNPAVTLTFWRLGKVSGADAFFYVVAQFVGGTLGVVMALGALGMYLSHPAVKFVATLPGASGPFAALGAEFVISLVLMTVVLVVSNTRDLARYTPWFSGFLVATYITFEAPISGMSMNPARSFGPALVAPIWRDFWVYVVAPPLGMLAAGAIYARVRGADPVACAKLAHYNDKRCIFRCAFHERLLAGPAAAGREAPEAGARGFARSV